MLFCNFLNFSPLKITFQGCKVNIRCLLRGFYNYQTQQSCNIYIFWLYITSMYENKANVGLHLVYYELHQHDCDA